MVPFLGRIGFFQSDIVSFSGVVVQVRPQEGPRAEYIEVVQEHCIFEEDKGFEDFFESSRQFDDLCC
jgi:hypothetical protein